MKRIRNLFLPFLVFAFVVACGGNANSGATQASPVTAHPQNDSEVFALYLQAVEELLTPGSMTIRYVMDVVFEYTDSGYYASMVITSMISQIIRDASDFDMQFTLYTEILDEPHGDPLTTYYRNGRIYTPRADMPEGGFSMERNITEAVTTAGYNIFTDMIGSLFVNEELVTLPGGTELRFNLIEDTVITSLFQTMTETWFNLSLYDDTSFGDISVYVFLDNDNLLQYAEIYVPLHITLEDEPLYISSIFIMEVLQRGNVTIDFPHYLDDFYVVTE